MRSIVLFALSLIGFPALALTHVDLYQAQIALEQGIDKPDAKARKQGMEEVIIRAAGSPEAVNNAVIQKALKQNAHYIAQISYGQQGEQQTLKMRFNGPQIEALLSQAQLPTWPAQRANLLVWLVEEAQSERAIIWEHSSSLTLEQMKQQAKERGLPLTIPVGDFDDVTGVTTSDLWGGFARPVGQASQRYPVDAVLVVRANKGKLRWTLYDQNPTSIGVTRQAPLSGSSHGADAGADMINQISDHYAKQSSVVVASESSESIQVRFTSLGGAIDFFVLEQKLQQLSSVASLEILKIQGKQVTFDVHLLATPSEFEQQVLRMREATAIKVEQVEPIEVSPQLPESNSLDGSQSIADSLGEEVLPQVTEPVVPQVIEPQPALMFEWRSRRFVAPAPTEVEQTDFNDQEVIETDIDV